MGPWRAVVKHGRIVLSEATDLPDGTVVYLQPVLGTPASEDDVEVDARDGEEMTNPLWAQHEQRLKDGIGRRARERVETLPRQRALDELTTRPRRDDK